MIETILEKVGFRKKLTEAQLVAAGLPPIAGGAAPFEIIGAPYTIYLAPVGTAFPLLGVTPAVTWFKLGTSGDKNYSDDGVTVTHGQNIEVFRGAGATAPRKAFRTEEDLLIEFGLADVSPDQYAKVLNDATVTTVPASTGIVGQKNFVLWQGVIVKTFALLARGVSSIDDAFQAQYEVASCFQSGEPDPTYNKGEPTILSCELSALDAAGDGAGFGRLRVQSAAALP